MPKYPPQAAVSALSRGDLRDLRAIIRNLRNQPDHPAFYGSDRIHVLNRAAKLGHLGGVRTCLGAGMDPDKPYNGFYPLHSAALHGKTEVCRQLILNGADVNRRSYRNNQTALLLATMGGYPDTAEELLQHGADPNLGSDIGYRPVSSAAYFGHLKTLRVLLAYGADANVIDAEGNTPLMVATMRNHPHILASLVEEGGARLNDVDSRYRTALMQAAEAGIENSLATLIALGADMEVRTQLGETALVLAAMRGNETEVIRLLDSGAHINARTWDFMTALMFAVSRGHFRMVATLVARGADRAVKNIRDQTALDIARKLCGKRHGSQEQIKTYLDIEYLLATQE